ncbi:MAG TPA: AraC family transcriptional regulator [Chitinophagaceae bacterium]|nr:AraC family transcriptional regulator [Chitinophagaceae bacterium]
MYNLYTHIATNPGRCRRLTCKDSLFTIFNCRLQNRYEDLWSHHNYIVYVVEGRKVWHTSNGAYDLHSGTCVFVRKGAAIVEQFFDTEFCFFLFFIPDEFICEVLKSRTKPLMRTVKQPDQIIPIHNSATIQAYFQSMLPYFDDEREPDQSLLELKFRELVLALIDNPRNQGLLSYFCSLLQEPQAVSLQRVMEENFCFNLKLEEFARLCSRSLSAFKRDFEKLYDMPPGKWLMERRLNHSLHLLTNMGRTVAEAAFESGFESPSHFSRSFRQRFGNPPGAMKQQVAQMN